MQDTTVRNAAAAVLGLLAAIVIWVAFATYNPGLDDRGAFFLLLVRYHVWIMVGMVVVSLVFGFAAASVLHTRLQQRKLESSRLLAIVLRFLSGDERTIVNYLVDQGGETTQAEISRLPRMTRVKAHRGLQKMQEKEILDVVPHGKVRRVRLKPDLLEMLRER